MNKLWPSEEALVHLICWDGLTPERAAESLVIEYESVAVMLSRIYNKLELGRRYKDQNCTALKQWYNEEFG